jgi:hypothetical protein
VSLFTVLIIVAMVVSTINEVATKRRKSQQQPPGAPPRRVPGGEAPRSGSGAGSASGDRAAADSRRAEIEARQSAEVLLPDDLWAVLTGERRPTTPIPEREPAPDPQPWQSREIDTDAGVLAPAGHWDAEGAEAGWERAREPVRAAPKSPAPGVERRSEREKFVQRPLPRVVSLESDLPSDDERHEAFHRRLNAADPAVTRAPARRSIFVGRKQLHRAMILREVLGPPRGLEDLF